MPGGAGSGAVGFTDHFMRDMNRQMGRLQRRLETRCTYRRSMRRSGLDRTSAERLDYPCAYLCGACGFLMDAPTARCPSCDGGEFFDLRDVAVGRFVQDLDTAERMRIPRWMKLLFFLLFTALGVLGAGVSGLLLGPAAWLLSLFIFMCGIGAYFMAITPLSALLFRLRTRRPLRWRRPLFKKKWRQKPSRVVRGQCRGADKENLTAPFSGTPCLAYQIAVLFDAPKDARPPEWVLEEVRNAEMNVAGTPIAADSAHLNVSLNLLTPEAFEAAGLNLERFLRQRGLFINDGEYWLFEAVLDEGADATVELFGDRGVVLRKESS